MSRTPGAHPEGDGVRFTLAAPEAEAVEVCLFDRPDGPEISRVALSRLGDGPWSARVSGLAPGQLYGFRVAGPWDPERGHRFNPAKLLADPRARTLAGELAWSPALLGSDPDSLAGAGGERPSAEDSAPFVPKSVVVAAPPRADEPRPRVPWAESVVYECHVRGMTIRHPEVPEALRGTYLGLAAPPVVEHLRSLGVTALELMPVQHIAAERHLLETGRRNYFGYSPLGWFAPHAGYATAGGDPVSEFRAMVERLHRAGLEVILDVVFNHTCEGDHRGPTLCWRGLANRDVYRLDPERPARYLDWTGCGNTVDLSRPALVDEVVDCLVWWTERMGADGFRFDLAVALARDADGRFDPAAPLFRRIAAEPALAEAKLIAEPWDLGPKGYRAGAFPDGWLEWDDRFRDAARRYWRSEPGAEAALGRALCPPTERRRPRSLHYVTCHDGFTLADLVSYESKHNEANGEGNRDGSDRNLSRNWGVEGPSDDPQVRAQRLQARKGLLATLAVAPGVPLLSHGDELGRTQGGNNNAYCHDSETTWVDWRPADDDRELLDFARRAFALRRRTRAGS